ncbi:MAG: hypothetical protein ACR2NU_14335 [Aeoliella sp.]
MIRFRTKSLLILMLIAACLATAAHWIWVRPSAEELARHRQQMELLDKMSRIPMTCGDWEAESEEVPAEYGGVVYLSRWFQHTKTGEKVGLALVAGHFRHVARFVAPNVGCRLEYFPGSHVVPAGNDGENVEFRQIADKVSQTHQVWAWSMTEDGRWEAPEQPRIRYGYCPLLYKMYFVTEHSGGATRAEQAETAKALVSEFAQALIPSVNQALFP